MPTNPMARKARNSFFLGVILMLIISLIVAFAFYFLVYKKGAVTTGNDKIVYAYRLIQDVKFGEEITSTMVEPVTVSEKVAPAGTFPSKTQVGDGKWVEQGFLGGNKAKVDLKAGTILAQTLTYTEDLRADLRLVEFNMISLPTTMNIGDTIDIRISFGTGEDFIVITEKTVENILGTTITLKLTEEEILLMNSAIVDAYATTSSNIYAIQYIQPELQAGKAQKTYVPTDAVRQLIANDANIVTSARNALLNRLNGKSRADVSYDAGEEGITQGVQKQIEDARKAREAYLSGLTTY